MLLVYFSGWKVYELSVDHFLGSSQTAWRSESVWWSENLWSRLRWKPPLTHSVSANIFLQRRLLVVTLPSTPVVEDRVLQYSQFPSQIMYQYYRRFRMHGKQVFRPYILEEMRSPTCHSRDHTYFPTQYSSNFGQQSFPTPTACDHRPQWAVVFTLLHSSSLL